MMSDVPPDNTSPGTEPFARWLGLPSTDAQRRAAVVGSALLLGVTLVVARLASVQGPAVPAYIAATVTLAATTSLLTAIMLLSPFAGRHGAGLTYLGMVFLYATFLWVAYMVTFPGVFSSQGLLGAGPQTAIWLSVLWWASLPLGILGYVLVGAGMRPAQERAASGDLHLTARQAVLCPPLVVILVTFAALHFQQLLPVLVAHGAYTALYSHGLVPGVWLANVVALAALVWRTRARTLLHLALCVYVLTTVLALTSFATSHGRYSVGWYFLLLDVLISSAVMLSVLLAEIRVLYATAERMQTSVTRERDHLQQIIEMLPEGVIIYDAVGTRLSLNRAATAMFGADLLGQPLAEDYQAARRLDGTLYSRDELPVARSIRTGVVVVGEQMLLRNVTTGHEIPILVSSAPLHAEHRSSLGGVAILQDISSIKASEGEREQLLAQTELARQWLQQILDVLPESVVVYNADSRVVSMNDAAVSLLGRRAEDCPRAELDFGLRLSEGVPIPLEDTPAMRALTVGEITRGARVTVRHAATGGDVPLITSAAPLRDATGTITGAVSLASDISAIAELEGQRDRVLGIVAHDLRNPLTSIAGMAQLLQMRAGRLDEPARERFLKGLQSIEVAARAMTAQIAELLDYAQVQTGREIALALEPTDVVALLRDVLKQHQQSTDEHTLELRSAEESIVAMVDARRLERAVANLLVNAIKYSPAGGPIVVSVTRTNRSDGQWLNIEVADRGVGIPADDLPRIFEQYYRASNVASSIPGTGIGLAGVRHMIARHGGSVNIDSTEGEGTTVTVRIPTSGTA